ncbi:MAG: YiiD C-terminal domain-containing protein [Nevskiales bacterium]
MITVQPPIEHLSRLLRTEIPLLTAMQISIERYAPQELVLSAPLQANRNPHGTAFGGSIATLGIASGWAWVYLWLQDKGITSSLVIQKHSLEYLKPVEDDFSAVCTAPGDEQQQAFLQALSATGKASIQVSIATRCKGETAAQHEATYTAILK